jgi:hypothetical protein
MEGSSPGYGGNAMRVIVTGWSATETERKLEVAVSNDPWTKPDPQAGDFELDAATIDGEYVERQHPAA